MITMKEMYKEFKFARHLGMSTKDALEWAQAMRACGYNPFED
jgi:hypothetical protein